MCTESCSGAYVYQPINTGVRTISTYGPKPHHVEIILDCTHYPYRVIQRWGSTYAVTRFWLRRQAQHAYGRAMRNAEQLIRAIHQTGVPFRSQQIGACN